MRKIVMLLIMAWILFCSGCMARIVQDGKIKSILASTCEPHVKSITNFKDLKTFCELNNVSFPPLVRLYCLNHLTQSPAHHKYKELLKIESDKKEKKDREDYANRVYGKNTLMGNAIINQKVRLGMTLKDVQVSWGNPFDINRTVGSWGVHEQWVYKYYHNGYLYFQNGILTSWQN